MVNELYPKTWKVISGVTWYVLWETKISKSSDFFQNGLKLFLLQNYLHEVVISNASDVLYMVIDQSNLEVLDSNVMVNINFVLPDTIATTGQKNFKLLLHIDIFAKGTFWDHFEENRTMLKFVSPIGPIAWPLIWPFT